MAQPDIHDHVDIHAMAQTTGVHISILIHSIDTKDIAVHALTSGAVFVYENFFLCFG